MMFLNSLKDLRNKILESKIKKRNLRMCPTYLFLNNDTGEEFEEFMSISSLDEFKANNPHLTQLVNGCPALHSGRGLAKPDPAFRDLLKHIKKENSKGLTDSTINTF